MTPDTMPHSPKDTSPEAEIEQLRRQLAVAEQRVQMGADRHRMILDSAVEYAVIALDLDGLVLEWNEGARRILGWTEAEMLGARPACSSPRRTARPGCPRPRWALPCARGTGSTSAGTSARTAPASGPTAR